MLKAKQILSAGLIVSVLFVCIFLSYAQESKPIELLSPNIKGGKPVMQALQNRKTMRDFSVKELPLQVLSDILWAAAGINRPASGGRTAPTAVNFQEIDVYVVKPEGAYLYDAKSNVLLPVVRGDIRALTGQQTFVKDAPVNLIFVANFSKMGSNCANLPTPPTIWCRVLR